MADVIKEFLVGLGYKVDSQGEKKFNDSVTKATKTIESFGKTMGVTLLGVAGAIEEISANLENLYYVAMKSNTTVSNLTAIRYGYSQVGVGADAAAAAVKGVADAINSNPIGYEGLFGRLGIQMRDVNGKVRDTTELLGDLVRKFRGMGGPGTPGFAIAQQLAGQYGIHDLLLFEQGQDEAEAYQKKMKQMAANAGLDFDDSAKKAHGLQQLIRDLGADLDIFEGLVIKRFYEPAKTVIEFIDRMSQSTNNLDQTTGGLSTWAATFVTALGTVKGAAIVLRGVLGIGSGNIGLGWLGALMTRLSPWAAAAYALNGGSLNEGESMRDLKGSDPTERDEISRVHPSYVDPKSILRTEGEETNNAMAFFMGKGYTRAQAAGIVANLKRESKLDPTAVGDSGQAYGIAQWHPDRQADFEKWAGHGIRNSTLEEQYGFVAYELAHRGLRKGQTKLSDTADSPEGSGAVVNDTYEIPKDLDGERAIRSAMARRIYDTSPAGGGPPGGAGTNVTQSNEVHITVNGTGDPKATGDAVAGAQKRVNADQLRNTKNALGRP